MSNKDDFISLQKIPLSTVETVDPARFDVEEVDALHGDELAELCDIVDDTMSIKPTAFAVEHTTADKFGNVYNDKTEYSLWYLNGAAGGYLSDLADIYFDDFCNGASFGTDRSQQHFAMKAFGRRTDETLVFHQLNDERTKIVRDMFYVGDVNDTQPSPFAKKVFWDKNEVISSKGLVDKLKAHCKVDKPNGLSGYRGLSLKESIKRAEQLANELSAGDKSIHSGEKER